MNEQKVKEIRDWLRFHAQTCGNHCVFRDSELRICAICKEVEKEKRRELREIKKGMVI